jgi:hypothetical protein
MNDFDNEYFLLSKPRDRADIPFLSPDTNTMDRDFRYARQDPFSPPLGFVNGTKDYNLKRGVKSVRIPPPILFNGSNMLVQGDTREALLELDIPNMCMHPAIYVHDDDQWYEDYWYVAFTERFDCWDRDTSTFDEENVIELGGFRLHQVYTYSLNAELLEKTPLKDRLLFQMGGVTNAPFVCHKSLYPLLHGADGKGAQLTLIKDF